MLVKKYNQIMQQPEEYRNRWAIGLTITLSLFIFVSFGFYKGFISFGGNESNIANTVELQRASNTASVGSVPSPLENSKKTLGVAFEELNKQYTSFKNSVSAVFVPFFTGIEVYERK